MNDSLIEEPPAGQSPKKIILSPLLSIKGVKKLIDKTSPLNASMVLGGVSLLAELLSMSLPSIPLLSMIMAVFLIILNFGCQIMLWAYGLRRGTQAFFIVSVGFLLSTYAPLSLINYYKPGALHPFSILSFFSGLYESSFLRDLLFIGINSLFLKFLFFQRKKGRTDIMSACLFHGSLFTLTSLSIGYLFQYIPHETIIAFSKYCHIHHVAHHHMMAEVAETYVLGIIAIVEIVNVILSLCYLAFAEMLLVSANLYPLYLRNKEGYTVVSLIMLLGMSMLNIFNTTRPFFKKLKQNLEADDPEPWFAL
jgi:hypothetical protein